jgi:hypothetical protein
MTNIRVEPSPLIMLPFAALLLSIALAPVILRHHWERHYHKLCLGLAAITSSYYVFAHHSGNRVLHAMLEYLSFMVAAGSFFVDSSIPKSAASNFLLTTWRSIPSRDLAISRIK